MGHPTKATEKRKQRIKEMLQANKTYAEVARIVKVSREYIRQIAVKNGFESPLSPKRIAERNKGIIKLLKAGKTRKQISEELGIAMSTIQNVVIKSRQTAQSGQTGKNHQIPPK